MCLNVTALEQAGLNLLAVFNIDELPEAIRADIRGRHDPQGSYRQLILMGHGGRRLWEAVQASGIATADPIDDFSIATATNWFAQQCPGHASEIIYPGSARIGLQTLGRLAGWHHDSPLRVGINDRWGTWFAYRVVILTDSELPTTQMTQTRSPCDACRIEPCVAACPARAVSRESYDLDKCVAYRKQPDSQCRDKCLARMACPAGAEHRYRDEQIRHTYSLSLKLIEGR